MKKIILISGIFAVVLNTIAFIILDFYNIINFSLVSFSLISAIALMYFIDSNQIISYRIGFSSIYSILAIIKIILSIISPPLISNNIILIILIAIVLVEILLLFLAQFMVKYASTN